MIPAAAQRVRNRFARAAKSYDNAAEIQRRVAESLIATLPPASGSTITKGAVAKLPATILDIGCGTGLASIALQARLPDCRLIGIDFAEPMLRQGPEHLQKICGNAALLPLADASADLVVSSLTYQWCALDLVLAEAYRVLRPGGWLAFSTLSGQTFHEIRQAFAGIDDAPHVLPLLPPDAVTEALKRQGFATVTVRQECHVARFGDIGALFDSIRRTGAGEVANPANLPGRRRGLLGKRAYGLISSRLLAMAGPTGELPLTYDVLYLGARKPGVAG